MNCHQTVAEVDIVFQKDGAPPHIALAVRAYLKNNLTDRFVGRAASADSALFMSVTVRSPNLNPLSFFLLSFVKL